MFNKKISVEYNFPEGHFAVNMSLKGIKECGNLWCSLDSFNTDYLCFNFSFYNTSDTDTRKNCRYANILENVTYTEFSIYNNNKNFKEFIFKEKYYEILISKTEELTLIKLSAIRPFSKLVVTHDQKTFKQILKDKNTFNVVRLDIDSSCKKSKKTNEIGPIFFDTVNVNLVDMFEHELENISYEKVLNQQEKACNMKCCRQ